ncbi:MAG: C1 family peptidase [Planctomycetota bacterium]
MSGLATGFDSRDYMWPEALVPGTADQGRARLHTVSPPRRQDGVACCVSATTVYCFELLDFYHHREKCRPLSVLFNYFTARKKAQHSTENPSQELIFQDGFEAARTLGICTRDQHPKTISPATSSQQPHQNAIAEAAAYQSWHRKRDMRLSYRRFNRPDDIDRIRTFLVDRVPVAIGIWLNDAYEGLNRDRPVLSASPGRSRSLHAVTAVGYHDRKLDADGDPAGAFLIKDSRGSSFGDGGYWWLPYALCKMLIYQAWTLNYEEDD